MQPEQNGVKTWQWVVTVIVIIVLVIIGYNIFSKGSTSTPTDDTTADTSSMDTSKDINRVVISDQFPGNIVYVSSVQLAQPGFVVINKDNAGVPGAVIGYQYFDKGINPGKITLTSPTVEGGIYYAALYSDNGDKKFNATQDMPLKDASGNSILKLFRASSSVTEVKG